MTKSTTLAEKMAHVAAIEKDMSTFKGEFSLEQLLIVAETSFESGYAAAPDLESVKEEVRSFEEWWEKEGDELQFRDDIGIVGIARASWNAARGK